MSLRKGITKIHEALMRKIHEFDLLKAHAEALYNIIDELDCNNPQLQVFRRDFPRELKKTPNEWEKITGHRAIDPDGWRPFCKLGEKSFDEPITKAEFEQRIIESTCAYNFNKTL